MCVDAFSLKTPREAFSAERSRLFGPTGPRVVVPFFEAQRTHLERRPLFFFFFYLIYLFDRQRSQVGRETGRERARKKQAPR